jgi:putative spermidine/putrescine transport system permease protein
MGDPVPDDRRRQRLRIALMLLPALAVIGLLFLGGLGLGLLQSFDYMPLIGRTDFTIQPYLNLLSDGGFLRSLVLTTWVSLASTVLSALLATVCALSLRRDFAGKRIVTFIFQLNIPVPHIVGAIAMMFLFAQSGLLARIAYWMDLIARPADFPALIYDRYGLGIILEYLWKSVPFTGTILLAVLQSVSEDYENVARNLGASRWQRFRYVLLPLMLPGLLRASVLVFAFTFGAFEVPYLLGQTYPAVLPVLAYRSYTDVDLQARPEAMAMSVVISVIVVVLILIYMKLAETYVRSD